MTILSAKVAPVKIGEKCEIEGLILETGEQAIAVQQIAKQFNLGSTSASRSVKRCLGDDYIFLKVIYPSHKRLRSFEHALLLKDFQYLLKVLSTKGNAIAQNMLLEKTVFQAKERCRSAYIYILIDKPRGVCKIGISINVESRLSYVQTGYPFPLSIHFTKLVKDARKKEKIIHASLADYRLNGEWFETDCLDMVDWSSLV